MNMNDTRKILILAAALLAQPAWASLDELQQLVETGRYESAYKLGQTMLATHGGQTGFDFLLGTAALKSGHASEAVFAFERILLTNPDHHEARLLLGDAYLRMGQQRQAGQAWQYLASRPSGAFGTRARERLNRLHSHPLKSDRATGLSAFAALFLGNDSNVNSSTAEDQPIIASPATVVLVDASAQETSDNFTQLNLGLGGSTGSGGNILSASFESDLKKHGDASQFDTTQYIVSGRYAYHATGFRFRLPLFYQQLNLDGADYLNYTAAALGIEGRVGTAHWLGLSVEAGNFSFDALPERDNRTRLTAATWIYESDSAWQRFEMRLYGGQSTPAEEIVDIGGISTNVAYLGRQFSGLTINNRFAVNSHHQLTLGLLLEQSEYDDLDPVYLEVREESYSRLALAWHWLFMKNTTLQVDVSSTKNDTDMTLYAYDRTVFRLGLRYQL